MRFFAVVMLCVAWGIGGCETAAPRQSSDRELPTMRSIRAEAPPPELLSVEGQRVTDADKARARITEVYLPLDVSLESAWVMVDEDVFPAVTRGVWRSNGMRVGLLHESQLGPFLEELPPTIEEREKAFVGYDQRSPLRRSPRIAATLYADLTVPPFAPKREFVRGHRLQLLAALQPSGNATRVELTPQHHVPRMTLRPREPLEKALDGRIFEELSVPLVVPGDRFLVLGLYRDPARLPGLDGETPEVEPVREEISDPTERQTGVQVRRDSGSTGSRAVVLLSDGSAPPQAEPAFPGFEGAVDARPPDPVPLHIGRGLFTQPWLGEEVQVLMLIRFRPI